MVVRKILYRYCSVGKEIYPTMMVSQSKLVGGAEIIQVQYSEDISGFGSCIYIQSELGF